MFPSISCFSVTRPGVPVVMSILTTPTKERFPPRPSAPLGPCCYPLRGFASGVLGPGWSEGNCLGLWIHAPSGIHSHKVARHDRCLGLPMSHNPESCRKGISISSHEFYASNTPRYSSPHPRPNILTAQHHLSPFTIAPLFLSCDSGCPIPPFISCNYLYCY